MTRRAFSLLEVLLATAILLGCVIVLGELAGIGRENADAAEEMATAQWLCQAKLNELRAGAAPLLEIQNEPLLEAPDWVYSVAIDPVAQTGLVAVRVTVSQAETVARPRVFSLVQWLRSRNYDFGRETATEAPAEETSAPEGEPP